MSDVETAKWIPAQLNNLDGSKAVVATIGIHDTVTDHADTADGPDGCSTKPTLVAGIIQEEQQQYAAAMKYYNK